MLRAIPFDASLLPLVQDFDCGSAPWQREVADFLKAPLGHPEGGAAQFVADREASVWLFQAADGQTVGYAALGEKVWSIPHPQGPRKQQHPLQYLLFLGVRKEFQHQARRAPAGAPRLADPGTRHGHRHRPAPCESPAAFPGGRRSHRQRQ